jgi:hypothetical protein
MRARDRLEQIDRRLEIIETILHIKDPGAARSADVFQGLRDRLEGLAGERRRHLLNLVELDRELSRKLERSDGSKELSELLRTVRSMLEREGVIGKGTPGEKFIPQLFEVVGKRPEGEVQVTRVHSQAYIDGPSGEILSQGRVEVDLASPDQTTSEEMGAS